MNSTTNPGNGRREFGHIYQRGDLWWIRYSVDGRRYYESSGSSDPRAAKKLLDQRQAALGIGAFVAPDVKRTTFEDLARMIEDDYKLNGRRSSARLKQCFAQLRTVFGKSRAVSITSDRLTAYVVERKGQGAALSTIRNELNALRKAFRLAKRAGKVAAVPEFPTLTLDNTRTGFFEPDDLAAVLAQLPEPLRPVVEFAALTGWRIPSEVLPLTWAAVDFTAGVVRLEVGRTKNREGRTFPFRALPALEGLLQRQRAYTRSVERRLGRLIPWVFHHDGEPIRPFNKTWKRACWRAATEERGGVGVIARSHVLDRIPHDLRRTAVRNLVRAGVPERVAMQLTGHKTRSVFDRYDIVNEADLAAGVEKLAAFHAARGTKGGQSAEAGV